MPPRYLQAQAGAVGVFHEVPLLFLARMNGAGLTPTARMLEIGSSCGRIARYLCAYLDPEGTYEGFDIVTEPVEWCRANITPAHPNFRFRSVSLANTHYRPEPSLPDAATFEFPYESDSFDFVCANSVFTHLAPGAASNYVRETARVLRPGGTACTTWFLWSPVAGRYCHEFATAFTPGDDGTWATLDPSVPERAVAYTEESVCGMFDEAGLCIRGPLVHGFRWIQDLCVADKPEE